MAHDVFVSYAKEDKAIADAICARLEGAGFVCWIAPRNVVPGTDWADSIVQAIGEARAFVLVFSAHSNESQQVAREVRYAIDHGAIVVPFRTDAAEPTGHLQYFIGGAHWLDALTRPIDPYLDTLVRDLRLLIGSEESAGDFAGLGTPATAASQPSQATARVDRVPHPEPAPYDGRGARNGSRMLVGALSALVVVGAIAGIAVALSGRSSGSRAALSNATTVPTAAPMIPPTTATTPRVTTAPTQNTDLRTATAQIDQMLVDASDGFTNLNQNILGPFINCTMSGAEAADRMTSVISNRQNLINTLNARGFTAPMATSLVANFVHAMQLSLDSDYAYQSWARANPGMVCPRTVTADKVKADSIGGNATAAKRAFAAQFNPVAAQFGLRADWTTSF